MPANQTDLWIVLAAALLWGLAWIGLLAAISLITHCLFGTKAVDIDRFVARSLRVSALASGVVICAAIAVWMVWKWKPDFGFFGRWIHPYWRLGEGSLVVGMALATIFFAVLKRRRKKSKG